MSSTAIELIFTQHGNAGVFYEADTYSGLQQIDKALSTAKTWGELDAMLPCGEFEELRNWISNGGEQVYWDGDNYLHGDSENEDDIDEDYVVRYSDSFSSGEISGVDEGYYPPRMDMMWDDLPEDFLEKYGKRVSGFMDGPWWEFPMEKFEEMKVYLSQHEYSVEKID